MRRQRIALLVVIVIMVISIWPWIGFNYTSTINQIENEINRRVPSSFNYDQPAITVMNKTLLATEEPRKNVVEQPTPKPVMPVALSKRVVEYHISVKLDINTKQLLGKQTVTWNNHGTQPVQHLYWHLYPNAFESPDTTFMRESGGRLRDDQKTEKSIGNMKINKIATINGEELLQDTTFIQPDDGNAHDHTLMKLTLPEAVKPGEAVTLNTEFTVQLPEAFARMGYKGDYVLAGQWFPIIAAFETIGVRGHTHDRWNLHQYHGNSEFYANFGIYDVRIDVPADYIVAATGMPLSNATTQGERKHYRFYAEDVHDFAWAASPHFVYAEQSFASNHVPGVKIKLYLDPSHRELADRYFKIAKQALSKFSEWYGSYPYSTLSIVVPPKGANGTGGMEYPTLVTGWDASIELASYEIERVIVHEIAHQFWYGMVANNEFEEAWLDEGFATYAEGKLLKEQLLLPLRLPLEAIYITAPMPLKFNAWEYGSHHKYAENVYTRARLVLTTIEQKVGEAKMKRILKVYFQKYKFKHPTTANFQQVVENVTGESWNAFFDQFVYKGGMTDFEIVSITRDENERDSNFTHVVTIRRNGASEQNIQVHLHFQDGTTTVRSWDGNQAQIQFRVSSESPLLWAAIDPDFKLLLENKRNNNFMRTELDSKAYIRRSTGIVNILESMIGFISW